MSQPNWDRIQEIYHAALALPRSERRAYVVKACAGDSELEREVRSLLDADDAPDRVLESPIVELPLEPSSASDQTHPSEAEGQLGTIIDGRYLIEKKLEDGGMGQVYLARDLRLDRRPVVIKILSEESRQDSYARERFKKEAEALSRIHHAGVVEVLDKGEMPDGRPYIVMQYVEGETLRSQIPSEGMNLERAASILKQIGAALEHVHDKDIFHRDLKPENIMLKRGTDSVVLVDFGIAKVRDSIVAPSTANGFSAGTLAYMSPEQLRGEQITSASDVYSMALIAYEMVTGRRPFNPSSASQLLELQRKGAQVKPVALRPNLPSKAEDVILRGMSFNVKARYKRPAEFGHHVARALKNEDASRNGWRIAPIKKFAAVVALIIITSAAGLFAYSKCNGDPQPRRSFTYWLMVQKVRDGKNYQDPFKSNGEETFERDDKFQLNVLSPAPGYLYVLNEGPPEPNDTNFTMIYPRRTTNNGSATLGANQSIQSDWITFRGPAGNENFWFVWSVSPVSQLEAAKNEAFNHPRGGMPDNNLVAVKEFLRMKQLEVKVTVYHYNANQNAIARGSGDLLITLAQFKYR
jgi:serine/threonine protein kinase